MFKYNKNNIFNWLFFPYILDNLEQIIDNLPIFPELFLLTSTLLLFVYGMFRKKYVYNYNVVTEFTRLSVIILSITAFLVWVSLGLSGRLLYENLLSLFALKYY